MKNDDASSPKWLTPPQFARSGQGAEWRPFVKPAVDRYAEKTGVRVAEVAVAALKAWLD